MSKISFISFCVEYYAKHTGKTSDEVYELFKREKVIELLESDYDDLHGMGMEYLMQFIDEYLGVAWYVSVSWNDLGNQGAEDH